MTQEMLRNQAAQALTRRGNLGSIQAVMQELPWLLRF